MVSPLIGPAPEVSTDFDRLALLHTFAFDRPWGADEIAAQVAGGAVALATPHGFILVRQAAGEAEILTLAVSPADRRQGHGRALVQAAMDHVTPDDLFLEVAADNIAALTLYTRSGFQEVGRRRGYYPGPAGPVDALVLRRGVIP